MKKKTKYPANNILFILFISIISVVYFPICQIILPSKFHFDSGIIRLGISNPEYVSGSFRNTSAFFRDLGFSSNTPLIVVQLLSWVIFILILLTILHINKSRIFSYNQILFISFFCLMYGAYFVNYSKDIIIILFFVLALNLPNINNNVLINIMLAILIYGYLFRTYWLMIFVFALIFLIIKRVNINKSIAFIFIMMICLIIIYNIIEKSQITQLRASINEVRTYNVNVGMIARSMIKNLLPNTSIITDIINYIYALISLLIPVQGFPSINVIIYYFWVVWIFIIFIKNKQSVNLRVFIIFIVYINIQALFEPDFGSAFRHQLAWFPIIYYSLNNINVKSFK